MHGGNKRLARLETMLIFKSKSCKAEIKNQENKAKTAAWRESSDRLTCPMRN